MPDVCSCGAQLPSDALFCHKCGKPQREITVVQPEVASIEPPAPPPPPRAAPPQPLPLNFHNPVAVRIAFLVALVTALLSWLPLLNIVMWAGAGFFAVFLYRRRTGYLLTVRAGVQMGWITGVMSFAITILFFTATALPAALSGGLGTLFQSQFKNVTDPNMQEALKMFESGPGLAVLLVFTLFMLFIFICALSIAGGALGAKVVGQD
ncbi:MAG TPA: zinc ribbon domain-containing protein [Bryobacteraceae bacterium]|nr:zinc ribbon domain-containing protein [Bryobacteraceae bacterium]